MWHASSRSGAAAVRLRTAISVYFDAADPYVKIWLLREGKKVEKRKSAIVEKSLNPVFNETFLFCVLYYS